MTTITLLADSGAGSATRPRRRPLYELLLPFADVNVVIGLAARVPRARRRGSSGSSR